MYFFEKTVGKAKSAGGLNAKNLAACVFTVKETVVRFLIGGEKGDM
jgi:hypothetical protein